jgi:hypothetical protein
MNPKAFQQKVIFFCIIGIILVILYLKLKTIL